MEFARYLDGMRFVATVYCRENYPDEVIRENGQIKDVIIRGICRYLERKVD